MKPELLYFDVFPKIVPADGDAEISIRPLFDHCRFSDNKSYRVSHSPIKGFSDVNRNTEKSKIDMYFESGVMHIRGHFEAEQEHILLVEEKNGDEWKQIGDFRLYSLEEDLFHRRPYKGDIHLHSCYSDGRESPGYVAAACRRIGFDFMAITDHRKYQPSIEAQKVFQDLKIDLRIYPGEEIHPPDNPVHMLNFGGKASVNDCFTDSSYRREVDTIMETLDDLPADVDAYQYASCLWCFDKIREFGGLGVFCHPYWFVGNRFDVSEAITAQLLDRQPYDALELIGGYHRHEAESNLLQAALYNEERAKGKRIPIVGVSDAHGCERNELFGWYYSFVFAKIPALNDLVEAIKGLYSVAVEAMPGSQARAHGPFRLIRYSQFLIREIFPRHDALCAEEGRQMLAYLEGDLDAADRLSLLKGQTLSFMDRLWGGTDKTL